MSNFNRSDRSGGRSFGRRSFGDRGGERREMHKAVCGKCGKECEVPFRPSGDRPVFCSDCFEKNGNGDQRRSSGGNFGRPSFNDRPSFSNDRPMFPAVCDKCGNSCNLPFQPRSGKPVYCSKCFEDKDERGGNRPSGQFAERDQYKNQFIALNSKLDKILEILSPIKPVQTVKEEKVKEIKEKIKEEIKTEVKAEPKKPVKKAKKKKEEKTPETKTIETPTIE